MAFPAEFTCAGADKSPPFAWGSGPSGTLSYALVLFDMFQTTPFVHWVLWDIPPATTTLPESLQETGTLTMPAGAKQAAGQGMGYLGPCPSGTTHTYKFTLYALDIATLPGVTSSTSTANLVAAIEMHDIASASLSATSNAKKP
jgi:Raf kinase inhibitor-like YbhB/YbcL family protein